ncbi:MAG: hypothetical protein U0166_06645 [Acidobacteriota bacterium]
MTRPADPHRRTLLKLAGGALLASSLPAEQVRAEEGRIKPAYFSAGEMEILREAAVEVLPAKDILDGTVDVAARLDAYLSKFPRYDFEVIRRGLRFLNAEITYLLARAVGKATALDRTAISKYLVTLGYYGDGNGEPDLPPEARTIWPRLGYAGPLGPSFPGFAPSKDPLPEAALVDPFPGKDPVRFLLDGGGLA